MGHAGESVLEGTSVETRRVTGFREEGRRFTGPLGSKVFGSAAWSDGSLMGRESRVERKDLAKESSVIVAVESQFGFYKRCREQMSGI